MADGQVPNHYWNNLLAITTKATAESGVSDVTPRPMSEENRKWLEMVMEELVKESDPGLQMDKILSSLHTYASSPADLNENDIGKIEELTDHLEDILGYAEITNSFVKKGGLLVVETFLSQREHLSLQCRYAEFVLSLTENNPQTQSLFAREGLLTKLIKLLEDETYSEQFLFKVLGAISGSVRSHIESFDIFCANGGVQLFSNIVRKAKSGKLAGKAARVLTSIAYTLEDSPSHVKLLTADILANFLYVLQNFAPQCKNELEYIGEYILDFIDIKAIPKEMANEMAASLEYGNQFLFKVLGAISGSVRSHIESFDIFCANGGVQLFSNIVRKAKSGKLAGKAARVLTSIAYTLEDSPSHVKMLTADILANFLYVLQNFAPQCKNELEYIGEYILDFIDIKAIPKEMANEMAASLEYGNVDLSISGALVKKLRSVT
ncbi:hypothetical protein OESDEN_08464 [Oesophagostomum dentatum]|uniref:Uncharacterized protein n=1 Tax=Oesophagostomum dentatum TaxID=61180 RepID=A0A0B1T8K0_OESDE|nr:hypothetical protein OESDEN_08464 [Oesophagostomum dentatum]